jgi:NADPH:quinone reductase-like Zn-dependent oxidoreductase
MLFKTSNLEGMPMKAAIYRKYGPPEVLTIEDIEKPTPKDDEVLVKVHSAAVNPLDYKMRKSLLPIRIVAGLLKPKAKRVGVDFAGEITAVGKGVTEFKIGDQVFGLCRGSCAEFVTVPGKRLSKKPKNITFGEAAAVPVAALTALQGLRDKAGIKKGDKVLIYGASGGVGHFSVQLARYYGAEVTAVCSSANLGWVKGLGAHYMIDYTKEDFTKSGRMYDIIFDTVGYVSFLACKSSLSGAGVFVTANFLNQKRDIVQFLLGLFTGRKRAKTFITRGNQKDLDFLAGLLSKGKLKPVIDRRYPLDQIVKAHRYAEEGHTKGKVVIEIIK